MIHEDDLAWFFGGSGAAAGVVGQSYGPTGGAVFDELASHLLHCSLREPRHRGQLHRAEAIRRTLATLDLPHVEVLSLAYTPRQFGWSSELAESVLRRVFRHGKADLLPLALRAVKLSALERLATCGADLRPQRDHALALLTPALGAWEGARNKTEECWWRT